MKTGERVGGESQVTGTGGKSVIAGQEGVAGYGRKMTATGEKVKGCLVDRTRMAMCLRTWECGWWVGHILTGDVDN